MTREEKSKKRKKNRTHGLKAVTESTDAVENNFKLGDEDSERKNKKKHKIGGSCELSRRPTKAEKGKGYVEVDDGLHVEKDQKKSKIETSDPTNKVVKNVSKNDDIVLTDICDEDKDDGGVEKEKDPIKSRKLESAEGKEIGKSTEDCDGDIVEKVEEKKRKTEDDVCTDLQESMTEESGDIIPIVGDENFADGDGNSHNSTIMKGKKIESVENVSVNTKPKGKSKEVRFSGHLDVKGKNRKEDLVQGKRFSKKEDEILKQAVYDYIKEHELGEEGLNMVLNCRSHPELKNCWKEIGQALPHRPHNSIYYHAHLLFETNRKGKWTKEEYERILEFQEQNGNKWKTLASELGKSRIHVKDTWRRIKLPNMKHGRWSQEEYQNLFNLVNLDLKLKASEQKRSKHGMLRDNIAWGAISDRLSTRDTSTCSKKWYRQLTSRMVADGKWSDGDDYRLIDALFKLDACCIEDVDWDRLLSHRSGDLCKKRWDQMVLHIGEHGTKSFGEQVDTLSKRYCPDLTEVRDAWDRKPVVP